MASETAARMSEADLDKAVRRILRHLPQLLAYHTYDSRRSMHGFPDLVIVGPNGVLWRELKRQNGKLTGDQAAWLKALDDAFEDAQVWRPSDLLSGDVARELAILAGVGTAAVPP